MWYALAATHVFMWLYFMSVVSSRPLSHVTTMSPRCSRVCNCTTAGEQQISSVYYSIVCDATPACLPVDVIASTKSVHLTGTGIPLVDGGRRTCEWSSRMLRLVELDLSWNNISDVRSWRQAAVSVRNLSVAGNNLRRVGASTFAGLVQLRHLDVSGNHVRVLDVDCFRSLKRLRTLSLANNSIAHLPRGVFDGLSSLVELRLDGNRLTSLGEGVLEPLSQLTVLSASSNRLRVVDARSFHGGPLTSLRQLDLSRNLLYELIADVAPSLTALRRLHSLTLLLSHFSRLLYPSIPSTWRSQ